MLTILLMRFKEKCTLWVNLNSLTFFTRGVERRNAGKDKAKLASFACFPSALHPNLALHGFD